MISLAGIRKPAGTEADGGRGEGRAAFGGCPAPVCTAAKQGTAIPARARPTAVMEKGKRRFLIQVDLSTTRLDSSSCGSKLREGRSILSDGVGNAAQRRCVSVGESE